MKLFLIRTLSVFMLIFFPFCWMVTGYSLFHITSDVGLIAILVGGMVLMLEPVVDIEVWLRDRYL